MYATFPSPQEILSLRTKAQGSKEPPEAKVDELEQSSS